MVLILPLCSPGFTTSAEPADDQPLHILSGVIVRRSDGAPLPGVQVVMAHAAKGYLEIGPQGRLDGSGQEGYTGPEYAHRNAKLFCDALTDDQGRFTLRSLAAPDEHWNLAAGDRRHGLVLLRGIVPGQYADRPLRIEIDAPADIVVDPPLAPTDKALKATVGVTLAPAKEPSPPGPGGSAAMTDEDDPGNIRIHPSWRSEEDQGPWHLGPFPPGFTYRVAAYVYGRRLGYNPTLCERRVSLAPGATLAVPLESKDGTAISGRITDVDDKPLADVNVLVRARDGTGLVLGGLSDSDGKYVVNGVPPGTVTLELLRHATRTGST